MTSTDESWTSWLCDLEPEDYNFITQSNTNGVEASFPSHHDMAAPLSSGSHSSYTNSSSTMSNSSGDVNSFERPSKTLKTSPSNTGYLPQKKGSSNSYILSFNNENPQPILNTTTDSIFTMKPKGKVVNHGRSLENQKKEQPKRNFQESNKTTHDSVTTRSPHHAQDHIIAERKRREKISQQFIALSALIPDLKKMDKASVLGDAIKHVKQLQEQVKVMEEEQNKRKSSLESVVYVEKSKSSNSYEDVSETSSNSGNGKSCEPSKTNPLLPEVEARVSEKNVLIRIHCEKQNGILMNIIKEIENLHLSVTTSSTMLFGTSKFDITIIAKMDEEFRLSVHELARNLRVALLQFM